MQPAVVSANAPASAQSCSAPDALAVSAAVTGDDAVALLERANALAARGEYAAALPDYETSRRLAREGGDESLVALATANAARAAVETGRFDGVEAELGRALEGLDSLRDADARAQLLVHVGRSYALLAERNDAARRSATRRASDAFLRAGKAANAAGNERIHSYALGFRAELYEQQGRLDDALQLTRRAIYSAQHAVAPDSLYRWQAQLGRIEIAAGRTTTGLAAYRDSIATLRDIRSQGPPVTEGGFEARVEQIYSDFVELLLSRAARSEDSDEKQVLLKEARDALEDLKTAELRDYFGDPCLDAQRKAASDTIPNTVVVYPVETLTSEVRAFRKGLERRTSREYLRHARTLYEWLIRPIEPMLAGGGDPVTLVFVPDGALRTIPFGALHDERSNQFLIEKHPIAVTPSLTLTDPRPIESGDVKVLAAGITEAVAGYPELVEVKKEIDAIRAIYPGRTLIDEGFSVEKLRSELTNVPFGIVHIASHGEFGGDISDNYLLAYDGRVSMDRLAAFVGATRFRADEPLELLTLSACESAAGDDRAALGLAGVALRAGARSALATLWSVNDRATAELIIAFYEQLHQPNTSRAQALQNAQVSLIGTRHYRHPAYWAPFILFNSWL